MPFLTLDDQFRQGEIRVATVLINQDADIVGRQFGPDPDEQSPSAMCPRKLEAKAVAKAAKAVSMACRTVESQTLALRRPQTGAVNTSLL